MRISVDNIVSIFSVLLIYVSNEIELMRGPLYIAGCAVCRAYAEDASERHIASSMVHTTLSRGLAPPFIFTFDTTCYTYNTPDTQFFTHFITNKYLGSIL